MTARANGPAGSLLLVESNHDLPLVRVQVSLRAGAAEDPDGREGLCNWAGELLGRGAAGRTHAQLDAAFDAIGTSFDVGSEHDGVTFEVSVLAAELDRAMALVADVLLRPDFPHDEAEKLRREIKAQLDEVRDDDGQLARRYFQRALFDHHPYGRSVLGTVRALDALRLGDARAWHEASLRGGNVVFGVAGAVEADAAHAALMRHFAALADGPSPARPTPDPPRRSGQRLTIVDKPERTQSQILIGQPAPRWGSPDFPALQVATTAFGGTFTARLMQEVRAKRGLSYGASARVGQARGKKALVVHVFPSLEQTAETLALVLRLYHEWAEAGLRDDEVAFAKGYLASSFAFNVATPEDRLDLHTAVELAGVGGDYVERFEERVRAVTPDDVRRVMRAELRPDELEILVVSTAEELQPRLASAGLLDGRALEIVPYDEY
jgi:zinc protease